MEVEVRPLHAHAASIDLGGALEAVRVAAAIETEVRVENARAQEAAQGDPGEVWEVVQVVADGDRHGVVRKGWVVADIRD